MDQALEILKWIGIILAAGFIGYFGRYLAKLLIGKVGGKRSQQASDKVSTHEVHTSEVGKSDVEDSKLEKKRLKIEKKKAKKTTK